MPTSRNPLIITGFVLLVLLTIGVWMYWLIGKVFESIFSGIPSSSQE